MPILMYHGIHPTPSPVSITPAEFRWQMSWLHAHGIRVLSLSQLLDDGDLPKRGSRSVVLTFDDGLECLYYHAFPVLRQFGFSATIFLVTGFCGRQNDWAGQPDGIPVLPLLNWTQVREMAGDGFEFGAHTVNHPYLDRIPLARAQEEIADSKVTLEDKLGTAVETFAYPYGRFNQAIREFVYDHYKVAVTTRLGLANEKSDLAALERVDVNVLRKPYTYRLLTTPLVSLYIGGRRILRAAANTFAQRPWH